LKYFEDNIDNKNIKQIWFNSGKVINDNLRINDLPSPEIPLKYKDNLNLSYQQGITLEKEIEKFIPLNSDIIKTKNSYKFDFGEFFILSPNKKDLEIFYKEWEFEREKNLEMGYTTDYDKPIDELINLDYEENGTIPNKSSIAFLYKYDKFKILFMGDAFSSIVENNIREQLEINEENRLVLDIVKVSHHAGNYGMSPGLLNIIDCKNFIISTD
jgi:hypothetical protein